MKAADQNKDQTYFLNQLSQRQLSDVLFPLQDIQKPEVRKIALENGLATAKKKDSTGICFIGERNFRKFLSSYLPAQKGKIFDLSGREVGEHLGLMYYTPKGGPDLGGIKEEEQAAGLSSKGSAHNVLYVSHGDESPPILHPRKASIGSPFRRRAMSACKIRYRQPDQK
ncbi:MAG: tRNA methyl transferase PRC-barrel domain-containing protein [Christensenellaceae bacterium]